MKLTKGKITKLYPKQKQTLKHYNVNKKEKNKKSFRKRVSLNFHNKTLKKVAPKGNNVDTLL